MRTNQRTDTKNSNRRSFPLTLSGLRRAAKLAGAATLALTAGLIPGTPPAQAGSTLATPVAPDAPATGTRNKTPDPALGELVASLEGGWTGSDNDTPFGKMPFALLFEWEEDGSLHSRSPLNTETYIDLRFAKDAQGVWVLHEEAAMEGLGVQRYSLVPSPAPSETGDHRWFWEQDPEFLSIDVGLSGSTMSLEVILRGRPHVAFRLDKQPEEAWAEMKRQMLARAKLSPEEGLSIAEVASSPPARLGTRTIGRQDRNDHASESALSNPIDLARRRIVDSPEDAKAHLALAQQLGAAINEDPANGPRHAFEMLSALEAAIALDNRLAAAYHYLVGYYLNAPPIAGGSIEKAEETARTLAEFDPEGGEELLRQIAARRAERAPDGAH